MALLLMAMKRCRVSRDELRQVARAGGYSDLCEVSAMVLEADGTISVLTGSPPPALNAVDDGR